MEKILDMVNQNVQDVLKKFQDTKNKEHEKAQKQIKELREDFNKHHSETKDTIKRETHELKMTTQNIKEELSKDMENLRKKETNRTPGSKKSLYSNKKHSGRPLQQTRTIGRQNLRAWR
jgi:flagellar biosynthesis GTPase FlhF